MSAKLDVLQSLADCDNEFAFEFLDWLATLSERANMRTALSSEFVRGLSASKREFARLGPPRERGGCDDLDSVRSNFGAGLRPDSVTEDLRLMFLSDASMVLPECIKDVDTAESLRGKGIFGELGR
jgi:hypothetical protein